MFSRDMRPERIDTLIGKSARVQGDVLFEGGLHLEGQVLGSVRTVNGARGHLTVSECGVIEGAVEAASVVLEGRVRGDVHASERLVLGATARIEGNVYYGVIEMTLGAQIVGKLVRLKPAGADAPAPASA